MVHGRSLYTLLGGLFLVGLGALVLLQHVVAVSAPFYLTLPGLALLIGAALGGKRPSGLVVPGCIVTTIGLIVLYQQATGNYRSWDYVWPLVLVAAGLGMVIQGRRSKQRRIQRYGTRTLSAGVFLFLLAGTISAFISSPDGAQSGSIAGVLWPLALIGAAAVAMLLRSVWVLPSSPPAGESEDPL